MLHLAGESAHRTDATVPVLFVADTTRDSVTGVENVVVDALLRQGAAVAEEAENALPTLGVALESDIVQGDPAPTIVDHVEELETGTVTFSEIRAPPMTLAAETNVRDACDQFQTRARRWRDPRRECRLPPHRDGRARSVMGELEGPLDSRTAT